MSPLLKRGAATVLAGGYTLSPIDFIPDVIPMLGQADDLVVILALIYCWYSLSKKDEVPARSSNEAAGQVIDIEPLE